MQAIREMSRWTLLLGLIVVVAFAAGCSKDKKQTKIDGQGDEDVVVISGNEDGMGGDTGETSGEIDMSEIPPREEDMDKGTDAYGNAQDGRGTDLLPTVYFDFDKSELRPDQMDILEENATWILQNPDYKVLLEGHCDERGTTGYNDALGQRRADSVLKFMLEQGIPLDRLNTVSYGESRPAVEGHNEEAWAKNRRVEFRIKVEPAS